MRHRQSRTKNAARDECTRKRKDARKGEAGEATNQSMVRATTRGTEQGASPAQCPVESNLFMKRRNLLYMIKLY